MIRARVKDLILIPGAIAGAGSDQAGATAINPNFVTVSGADGSVGVRLPEPTAGRECRVYNLHATAGLKVYPHVGGDINDGTQNAAVTIEGKSLAIFWAVDGTTWAAIYTANT